MASHVQAFDLHQQEFDGNKGRHERMRTRAQLDAIRSSGGMVAAMLKDDVQDTDLKGGKFTLPYSPVVGGAHCRQLPAFEQDVGAVAASTPWTSWARRWRWAVTGTARPDISGRVSAAMRVAAGARRTGFERPAQIIEAIRACSIRSRWPASERSSRQVTGFKTFDYNVDGLAHIGLVPDMVADLQRHRPRSHYVDNCSVRSKATSACGNVPRRSARRRPVPDPNRPWLCDVTDNTPPESTVAIAPALPASGWYNADVVATITATADSGVEQIDYAVTAAPLANGPVAGDRRRL